MSQKNNNTNSIKQQSRRPFWLIVYLLYLFIFTLAPFEFSDYWLNQTFSIGLKMFIKLEVLDAISNIILFIPFGFLFSKLVKYNHEEFTKVIWIPVISGAFLSGIIEVTQLFLHRTTSIIDFVTNIGGTVSGFYLAYHNVIVRNIFSFINRIWKKNIFRVCLTCIYILLLTIIVLMPSRKNNFNNWDDNFHFLIGNEATFDRAWEGEIFMAAVYDRALRKDQAHEFYRSGVNVDHLKERHNNGLTAFYNFMEGNGDIVHDVSIDQNPLNLKGNEIEWISGGNGVTIYKDKYLKSIKSGIKITRALRQTSQMSIEVWLRTSNLTQSGPARILTLSESPDQRNFTLGQQRSGLHLRVRTPQTGINGSRIHLKVNSILEKYKIHHIVASYNRGVAKLWIDGQLCRKSLKADSDYLSDLLKMGRNLTARISVLMILFFPFGFLMRGCFNKIKLILTLLITAGFVFAIESYFILHLGQTFGIIFFLVSTISAFSGVWMRNASE
jgi:glycopeptide antibiotics resistance protein